jgi:hypothetical protein
MWPEKLQGFGGSDCDLSQSTIPESSWTEPPNIIPVLWRWSKGKGIVHSRTGHEDPQGEQRFSSTLSLTSALDGVGGQRHAPAALPPGKTRYPLNRRLGRPQGLSWQVRKISHHPGFDPRIVQPVTIRYTDWANPDFEGVLTQQFHRIVVVVVVMVKRPTLSVNEWRWYQHVSSSTACAEMPTYLHSWRTPRRRKNYPSSAAGYSVQTMRRIEIPSRKQGKTDP